MTRKTSPELSLDEITSVIKTSVREGMAQQTPPSPEDSHISRGLDWLDMILSKLVKVIMITLEAVGVFWIFHMVAKFESAIYKIASASNAFELARGKEILSAVKMAAESTYTVVLGVCVAIPTIIAVLKTRRRKWEMEQEARATPGSEPKASGEEDAPNPGTT